MAVKLIDLQLIYGVAGAREKFEDLASQLVKDEQPDAGKVRVVQGDGGIDVFVGQMNDPNGIEVYQCKFFQQGIHDAQKKQIRDSYARCRDSTKYTLKKWTLCLPVDLSGDERRWFEDWRAKRANDGIEIGDPWGATKLEGLLYCEKNRGLKEAFFKEEYLTQIREMHSLFQRLLPDIAQRLRLDASERDQARRTEALERQTKAIDHAIADLREIYLLAATQCADRTGFTNLRPSHWEIAIHQSLPCPVQMIAKLGHCWSIAEDCQLRYRLWVYPEMARESRESGADWIGANIAYKWGEYYVESWRLHQNGLFIHMFPVWDDYHPASTTQNRSFGWLPEGVIPKRFLTRTIAIRTITHIFRFAQKLAAKAYPPTTEAVRIAIRLNGTQDRVLVPEGALVREFCRANAPALELSEDYTICDLQQPDVLAVNAAHWFFERFNWQFMTVDSLAQIQRNEFERRG